MVIFYIYCPALHSNLGILPRSKVQAGVVTVFSLCLTIHTPAVMYGIVERASSVIS
jgi:hypothetical protein